MISVVYDNYLYLIPFQNTIYPYLYLLYNIYLYIHCLYLSRNKYQNVNFLVIESSCDFRTIISEWNVSTNLWLNQFIYQRLGRTFKANLTTYLVSALWHGFYPGYYVTFVSGALYTALTRLIYKSTTWPFHQKYRKPLLYVPNYLLFDYFASPFVMQTFQDSWRFCRAWGFYGHIFLFLGFAVVKAAKLFKKNKK